MKSFSAFALEGFPLVTPGSNIARLIVKASQSNGLELQDGDVVVVAQKVISKADKRMFRLRDVAPSERAKQLANLTGKSSRFVELVLRETKKVLKATRDVLLVEDRRGLVCINAGIDKSNVEGKNNFALLPENPDASARKCRQEIQRITGKDVAVVICDTYSRPFRRGQVNFAIGAAGICPFRDYRGKKDLFDQVLKFKNVAVVDEIAAASELLMGQGNEGTPVVVLRGLSDHVELREDCTAEDLKISSREDLFRGAL